MNKEFATKNKSGSMENSYFVEGIQGAGKTTMVAKLAKEKGVPTILISGMIENSSILKTYFHQVESVVGNDISAEQSLNNPSYYLEQKVTDLIKRLI